MLDRQTYTAHGISRAPTRQDVEKWVPTESGIRRERYNPGYNGHIYQELISKTWTRPEFMAAMREAGVHSREAENEFKDAANKSFITTFPDQGDWQSSERYWRMLASNEDVRI